MYEFAILFYGRSKRAVTGNRFGRHMALCLKKQKQAKVNVSTSDVELGADDGTMV